MENLIYFFIFDRDVLWSDVEIFRLLEGFERFDDDWGEIVDYVGIWIREECVFKFF